MAPRSAKSKKATEENIATDIAPKKGSKAKVAKEAVEEPEVNDIVEKKTKRGKKATETNGVAKTNGSAEEVPKKGRKKNVQASKEEHVDENEIEQEENVDSNGHTEDVAPEPSSKKMKSTKKEVPAKPEPKAGRGKKNAKQESNVTSQIQNGDDEAKPAAKGRGRKAAPKAKEQVKPEDTEEDTKPEKPEAAAKGRKKAPAKQAKNTPEPGITEEQIEAVLKEEIVEEEEKKKVTKGRKNQPAKTKAEDKPLEEEEPSAKKRKTKKKDEKGQGDMKSDDAEVAPKPKGKRGQKAVAKPSEGSEPEEGESDAKRKRKPAEEKAPAEDKKKAPLKNKSVTSYEDIDFSNTSKNPQGKEWNFKIASWNVDGIRAWIGKGGLEYLKHEKPDILCMQEVKCSKEKLPDEATNLPGYHAYWLCSDKDGYAGVGIYTTKLAINVQYGLQNEELDSEGRIITAEYEQFYLISTYVPNAGRKLVTLPKRLQWNEEFRKHVKELDKKKPVIICGDMNVAHNEIDLANPKTNKKNAGFTQEERSGMSDLLGDGFVDTFRQLNPDATGAYTFWTYMMGARAKNVGWRLDYFIVSERLLPTICDSVIRDQVYGSDHCPISLFLHLTNAEKPKESP